MHNVFRDLVLADSREIVCPREHKKEDEKGSDQKIKNRSSLVSQKPDPVIFVILLTITV
jgi:hypothetical protein